MFSFSAELNFLSFQNILGSKGKKRQALPWQKGA